MLEPWRIAFDISSVSVSTALPGIAWALLFILAWRHPAFSESLGLGPKTFWLLLPGAILASFALLPVGPVSNDILAISFAGAIFPLGIAVVALERVASPLRRWTEGLFLPLAAETGVLLAVAVLGNAGRLAGVAGALGTSRWNAELGLVAAVAAVGAGIVAALAGREGRALGGTFALTTAVLVLTFLGARAIPGVGIVEDFPYFLLPPVLAGVVAAAVAPRLFPGAEARALPVAFFAGGWGVALGADVLWQPPLYAGGSGGLYAVGGAGVLDLVYLSCFLGLLGAWGTHRLLGRSLAPVGPPLPFDPPSPGQRLREAYFLAVEGSPGASLCASATAARAAALQAQRLLDRSSPDPANPWSGLGVPGWVVSDQANLESSARAGSNDPREAMRAYVTASALARIGQAIGFPRFASIGERLGAFFIDAGLLGAVASVVFAGIVFVTPGGLQGALTSIPFNAAIYGFVSVALLYFALSELGGGATVGKAVLGIEVRDRGLGRIRGVAAFVRNAPLLPVMTLYSIGLALSIALAMRGVSGTVTLAGISLPAGTVVLAGVAVAIVLAVAIVGSVGVVAIALTRDRQRVGDLWAGTWVVRRLREAEAPPSAGAPAGPYG